MINKAITIIAQIGFFLRAFDEPSLTFFSFFGLEETIFFLFLSEEFVPLETTSFAIINILLK